MKNCRLFLRICCNVIRKDYGYWNVPYFQQKAAQIGPETRILIDRVIARFAYPVQAFRSCFGILRFADRYTPEALEACCHDAILAGRCNYSYVANTIATYDRTIVLDLTAKKDRSWSLSRTLIRTQTNKRSCGNGSGLRVALAVIPVFLMDKNAGTRKKSQ